ncbi:MAG: PIN domain-containing protein [Methylovulum sp.]|uniref:type II toxin-antitoxin system VapC family toxin n=1 Tax=Methylovulum sp. TaxID=1916980 RepID=UPI002638AF8D|nr:PIN domain-containing protein [Methylovulum sp.]MDD2722432.1 PIN domain-containing protein [Methylovulum sp.]MDD5124433.1 PIN domain-containing protein [Methylovulum sp.]
MKIYLDNCCLNRPFDNQADLRIHLEAEAVKTIITLVEQRTWQLIGSSILKFEIAKLTDNSRKRELALMESLASEIIVINQQIAEKAKQFENFGLQAFDALHLACAENNADVLLTVDDKFIRKAKNITKLGINICNPIVWLNEVLP